MNQVNEEQYSDKNVAEMKLEETQGQSYEIADEGQLLENEGQQAEENVETISSLPSSVLRKHKTWQQKQQSQQPNNPGVKHSRT